MSGSAGSLDKEKTDNKFVIPTESYRDEGMSYHYAKANVILKLIIVIKLLKYLIY